MKRFYLLLVSITLLGVANAQLPYTEEDVSIANGSITLSGTLTLPEGEGPFPALVLISGSGPQNRDEEISIVPGYQPFRWIAEHLAREGFAVLRYDDRGTGKSTGVFATATTADFATDAEAALEYLIHHEKIDPLQVGVFGHSEGGIIAAMMAARNPQVAFVIAMAGPSVRGYELLVVQAKRALEASGLQGDELTTMLENQRKSLDLILAKDWQGLENLMYPFVLEALQNLPAEERAKFEDLEAEAHQQTLAGVESTKGWMAYFVSYDPSKDWEQITVPVLALFGELDVQVDVVQNKPVLEAALAKAGNDDVTIKVFPTANHLFQTAVTGSPDEYATLEKAFVPEFLITISSWLNEHVKNNAVRLEF